MTQELASRGIETAMVDRPIPVFVSGLPGNMATLVARALIANVQYELLPIAQASVSRNWQHLDFGPQRITLRDYCPNDLRPGAVAVDYTQPQVATSNAEDYAWARVPFVMGTTGGNREEIEALVRNSRISAVIAPNMAVSVIEVQDELNGLIETSPDHFRGWHMTIRESHQATKVYSDGRPIVSGTAVAFRETLERLGAVIDGEIVSIRDPQTQQDLGIQNLDGHGYHWITLTSPAGEIRRFATAVEGRQPYVEGTLMAVSFLARKIREGSRGEIFTMSDVIREEVKI